MAKTKFKADTSIEFKITLEMSLDEAKALEALTKYNIKEFLEVFYKNIGTSYLKPHEKAFASFMDSIKKTLPSKISRANAALDAFSKVKTDF